MKFNLTLPHTQIESTYQRVLKVEAQKVTLKGFRTGKAPLNLVEDHLDKAKLYELVLNQIVPPIYNAYLKAHDLKPIIQPKISLKDLPQGKDWEVEVEIAEKPAVKLNDYQKAVTDALKQAPKKDDHQVDLILDTLLKTCTLDIPELLISESVDYSLSKLVDQVSKLGLSLDKYLSSLKKTPESLRQEYAETSERDLKIEFILEAIASDRHLHPSQAAVDKIIEDIKDPQTQKFVQNDLSTQDSIRTSLMRTRVVEYLKSLGKQPIPKV